VLDVNPTYASQITRVDLGADHAVIAYVIAMTPTKPFTLGLTTYVPDGSTYPLRALDVIRFRDGRVASKHTWFDIEAVRRKSRTATPAR
jgi:hypothetical protein